MAKNYKYQVKSDDWYKWRNVPPPERVPNLTEDEVSQALQDNLKGHTHDWYQVGNEIKCDIGSNIHGKRIGSKLRLDGTGKDGEPLLVPVGPIYRTK